MMAEQQDGSDSFQQEVSGSYDTLAHMIDAGEIERPRLMTYNQWQTWRSRDGRRPTVQRDGVGMPQRAEALLWKQTMLAQYGEDWQVELETGAGSSENPAGEAHDPDLEGAAAPEVPPLQARPAGEVLNPGAAARAGSPGSGVGSTTGLTTPRRQSTRDGQATPTGSWSSASPGTQTTLTTLINKAYDPAVYRWTCTRTGYDVRSQCWRISACP